MARCHDVSADPASRASLRMGESSAMGSTAPAATVTILSTGSVSDVMREKGREGSAYSVGHTTPRCRSSG